MTTKPPGPVLVTIETDDGYTLGRVAIRPGGPCFDCNATGVLTIPADEGYDDDPIEHTCPFCEGLAVEPEFVRVTLPMDTVLPDGWRWATTADPGPHDGAAT